MVVKIRRPKILRRVLRYNEKKVEAGTGILIAAEGFLLEKELLSFDQKLKYLRWQLAQNQRAKRTLLHMFLHFDPRDKLDSDKLSKIAKSYMEGIGFGDQPYLVYQHMDARHSHCHIVSITIKKNGERIETYDLQRNKAVLVAKELEKAYGLKEGVGQPEIVIPPGELLIMNRAKYRDAPSLFVLSHIAKEVTELYKFRTLAELNAVLNQFGVYVSGGRKGSFLNEVKGLIYGFLNKDNKDEGKPIKASDLYSKPILKKLEPLFIQNRVAARHLMVGIKRFLDRALYDSNNLSEMATTLKRFGIRILLRKTRKGRIHGVTYIDNNAKCVFTARDLGREFGLKALKKVVQWLHEKELNSVVNTGLSQNTGKDVLERKQQVAQDFESLISQLTDKKPPAVAAELDAPQRPARDLPVMGWIIEDNNLEEGADSDFPPGQKLQKGKELELSQGLSI